MKKVYLFFMLACFVNSCSYQTVEWPEITKEMKPWIRWHWMGNAVDQQNLKRELREMADAGLGGVDIQSVYGVRGEEHRFIEYLSADFSELIKYAISEAHNMGLGVDMSPNAGWPIGGTFVPEENAIMKLIIHRFALKTGETWQLPDTISKVVAVSFFGDDKNVHVLNPADQFFVPSSGIVYVAEGRLYGMMVKRPSPGGEGLVINPFNREIINWYLNEFWRRINLEDGSVRCFFHDSFEYYGADFTLDFMKEFIKRRGYDLSEFLYVLAGDCDDKEISERIRSDYRETLSDLLIESFIGPYKTWTQNHKFFLRNQAHGSPGNILDIYAASDIPETEKFGQIESGDVSIFVNKFASSAAHVSGKKLVSSESFTWLNDHWKVTPSNMMQATNLLFLAGVNHMFFNNGCYSPEDAEWPGWLVYASTQMHNRNPLWREIPSLFKYIKRSQSILQNATPQNDLLVYWPYFDVAAAKFKHSNYTNIDKGDDSEWFKNFPLARISEILFNSGYNFDYISDKQLLDSKLFNGDIHTSSGLTYKAIVVPNTKYIPDETMQQFKKFIDEGAKVYFDKSLPESVPGMFQLASRHQKLEKIKNSISKKTHVGDVIELLGSSSIQGEESLLFNGFHYLKMKLDHENWYMIFNCGNQKLDSWVQLNSKAKCYVFYFPENGEISLAENKGNSVRLQLEPVRAVFVQCSREKIDVQRYSYLDMNPQSKTIEGSWNIQFIEGGPVFPDNIITDQLQSWTGMGDEDTKRFSGTALYSTKFFWNEKVSSALLDLGEVKDCARVKLNGRVIGSLLGPTYKIKVDNLIKGENLLEVEVTNVAANRIRDYDIRGVSWKKFYNINFIHINGKPFDATNWDIRESGLLGPVKFILF